MLFAFKIFLLPVPTRPGTRTFLQLPDPSRPEVKNPYPSDPVDQREVSIVRLGMLESSGLRRYSTLLVIQLFSRRLCLCHCLCIRLCLCICVPNSFLNSYYHKLSENVWVRGCWATRSEIWTDVTIAGRRTRKDRATQPMDHGRLR